MKKNKTEQEVKPYTNLLDELIFVRDTMKEAKQNIQIIEQKNAEMTRDCTIMARELYISKLAYENNFTNFEKRVAVFLFNGQVGEEAIKNIHEAIEGYLESLKVHDEPIPPPIHEEVIEVEL